jgi:hypothetical protein
MYDSVFVTRTKTSILTNAAVNGNDPTGTKSFVKICLERVMAFQSVVKVDFRL